MSKPTYHERPEIKRLQSYWTMINELLDRSVRASFALPGAGRRPTHTVKAVSTNGANVGHPRADAIKSSSVADAQRRSVDNDLLRHLEGEANIRQVADRMEIDFILGRAPSTVACSLRLILRADEPVQVGASAAQVSGFSLKRQMKAFLSTWGLAA